MNVLIEFVTVDVDGATAKLMLIPSPEFIEALSDELDAVGLDRGIIYGTASFTSVCGLA